MDRTLRTLLSSSLLVLGGAPSALANVETLPAGHADSVSRKGWAPLARAGPSTKLRLTVAVRQENLDELTRVLEKISDPDSEHYGKFLTAAEVDALVAPSEKNVARVAAWLRSAEGEDGGSVTTTTRNGDFLHVDTTVARAEKLLGNGATYMKYHHAASGKTITRLRLSSDGAASPDDGDAPYTLPDDIAPLVDFVAPTVTFPPVDATTPFRVASPQAKPVITPPKLRALANLTDNDVGKGTDGAGGPHVVKQGVASFLGPFYDPADLKGCAPSTTSLPLALTRS